MANGLYTPAEISRMTDRALDELMAHYQDTGNVEGVQRVQAEQDNRADDLEAVREQEMAWQAEQDRAQQLHDEMINDMMATDGRWG